MRACWPEPGLITINIDSVILGMIRNSIGIFFHKVSEEVSPSLPINGCLIAVGPHCWAAEVIIMVYGVGSLK